MRLVSQAGCLGYQGKLLRPHQREGVQFMGQCMLGQRDFDGNGMSPSCCIHAPYDVLICMPLSSGAILADDMVRHADCPALGPSHTC